MAQTADIFSNIGKKKEGGNDSEGIKTQTIVSLLSQFGLTAVGFLSTIYFTRVVDPALVGIYFLFFSYYTIFYLFSESGIGEASVKLISEGRDRSEYYSASMAIRAVYLVFCLIVLALMALFVPASEILNTSIYWWVAAALCVDFLYNSRIYAAYADGKVNAFQTAVFLNISIRSVFQILFVYGGYHVFGLEAGFFIGMIAAILFTQRYIDLKFIRFLKKHLRAVLKYAVLIFLVMSCYIVYQNIDVVMIGWYMTETDAGIYRIVYQFSMLAGLAANTMKTVLYPKFSAWNEEKKNALISENLKAGVTFSLMLAVPIFFSFLILGNDFIRLFYGSSYLPGVSALYILSFIQIITVFMYLQCICLNAISHPKFAFLSVAAGIFANVILNMILIPSYGLSGAALATVFAMSLNTAVTYLFLKKVIDVKYNWKSVWNMTFASLLMCVFLLGFKQVLPITNLVFLLTAFTAGGLLYGFLILKIDRIIRNKVAETAASFGIKWPGFL
ncbi:MAG: flippase [Methanimicrococcus sp.]|nr:flippase [Methanimicrococcus sp.]